MEELKKNVGITLVALVVSIVVMLILAGVSINAIVGENGILTQAQSASYATTYAGYLEDLQLEIVISGDTPTCVGSTMQSWISSMKDEDLENFIIIKGELYYIGSDETAKASAESVGINTDLSGGSAADVITIVNKVILIDDATQYVGTPLYTKGTYEHNDDWKMAIDYNGSNKEIARYGTGYYLLEPNVEYTITNSDGEEETVTFSDYYVIDYSTSGLIGTNNITVWDANSTLAVNHDIVLNIDPTNLGNIDYTITTGEVDEFGNTEYDLQENGSSTGIMKYGDVEYDSENSALVFNESDDNAFLLEGKEAGGGYLALTKSGVDFSDGFSFEIYANLSRLRYDNGSGVENSYLGLFCRIPTLSSSATKAMRFGYSGGRSIGKFANSSSWIGAGENLSTGDDGGVYVKELGFGTDEGFYLTYVYRVYDAETADEYQQEYYTTNGTEIDKVEYYINGELYGYTYYGHDSYQTGLKTWNTDECPFFLGVCPWYDSGNLYYLKGTVYTCRLYTYSMTEDEVGENYEKTLQYRESFT